MFGPKSHIKLKKVIQRCAEVQVSAIKAERASSSSWSHFGLALTVWWILMTANTHKSNTKKNQPATNTAIIYQHTHARTHTHTQPVLLTVMSSLANVLQLNICCSLFFGHYVSFHLWKLFYIYIRSCACTADATYNFLIDGMWWPDINRGELDATERRIR